MKITVHFRNGEVATFERGKWQCADETILACCTAAVRRHSPNMQPDLSLRGVRRFAARMGATLEIVIPPPPSI